ncbi:MAG: bifunctional nicotinamidase/pyrazinamidase [Chlamydiales bacterium]
MNSAKNRPEALLLVDLQKDFLPGGALPVPQGNEVIPIVNQLLQRDWDVVVASKDWHPENHGSFASTHGKNRGEEIELQGLKQILWPDHCVQYSEGAEFASGWNTSKIDHIVYKGTDVNIDSYSAFFDNGHKRSTGLHQYLQKKNIHVLHVAGLALDYCVKFTVLDALHLGYEVYLYVNGCRAINKQKNDEDQALAQMEQSGAHLVGL